MITVKHSQHLLSHLQTYKVDDGTVASLLFEGGRLSYPGRKALEHELGYIEPYTLEHEARVISGLPKKVSASIRLLASDMTSRLHGFDITLDLLWQSHQAYQRQKDEGPSLDRFIAALVAVKMASDDNIYSTWKDADDACYILISGLHSVGFPPTADMLEELWDGAAPASVGLGIVEL
jgi:hypothetical protein